MWPCGKFERCKSNRRGNRKGKIKDGEGWRWKGWGSWTQRRKLCEEYLGVFIMVVTEHIFTFYLHFPCISLYILIELYAQYNSNVFPFLGFDWKPRRSRPWRKTWPLGKWQFVISADATVVWRSQLIEITSINPIFLNFWKFAFSFKH